ncbi:MAG TPA: tripartite tricarboxylate transporter substrate binding protein [Burkholderiales bacterium]|nr:tripartite tricarboxylate transporter substrate binding protein [Burkholderiales bacterium]
MLTALLSGSVHAQYPERPLRFVIPFPPGGGADNLARIVAQPAAEMLRQQIVIDNRAGAGGNIAAETVAKAAPDGYTLLQANVSHAISASLYRKLPYDLLRDFDAVTQLASIPFVLLTTPSFSAPSIQALIAAAKAKPGAYTYASSGAGGPSHMAMEMMKAMAGIDIRHVPYKGAAPAATDVIAGQVQMGFFTVSAALPLIAGGRVRALAIASTQRTPLAPDIPTASESGLPGFEATTWFGVMVPKGTPAGVVNRLHEVFVDALKQPTVRERLVHQGFDLVGSTPGEFSRYVQTELPKWAQAVKASHASTD